MPWTVFVEPLDARIRHIDLRPQLDWLAEHGHEIALHVHHRPLHGEPGHTSGYEKRMTADPTVVDRCMDEASEYLHAAGHHPVGFVAGTWLLVDSAFEWLTHHAYRYDCSVRTYPHTDPEVLGSSCTPEVTGVTDLGGVLEVPTTASLRQQTMVELHPRPRDERGADYDLFYLHDYDLLDARKRLAVRMISHRRRASGTTVSSLVAGKLHQAQ